VVRTFEVEHNHTLSSEKYGFYAYNRRLTNTEKKQIYKLLKDGGDVKKIVNVIEEKTGKLIQPKQIHNLRTVSKMSEQQMNSETTQPLTSKSTNNPDEDFDCNSTSNCDQDDVSKKDDEEVDCSSNGDDMATLIRDTIMKQAKFEKRDSFQCVSSEDDAKSIIVVFYQSEKMQKIYKKFGRILYVDGTYKLNDKGGFLYLFTVEDSNNNSQIVAAALTASYEKHICLKAILKIFSNLNDNSITDYVMIDKDPLEQAVFKVCFFKKKK
jgi:hypothetical protein